MADRNRRPLRGASIAILAAAIGSFGSLIGVVVASANAPADVRAQLDHEDQVRLFDLRRDAYQRFISVATQYVLDVQAGRVDESTTIRDTHELLAASSEIHLVGSNDAALDAEDVTGALIEVRTAKEAERVLDNELTDFVDNRNNELSQEPLGR